MTNYKFNIKNYYLGYDHPIDYKETDISPSKIIPTGVGLCEQIQGSNPRYYEPYPYIPIEEKLLLLL